MQPEASLGRFCLVTVIVLSLVTLRASVGQAQTPPKTAGKIDAGNVVRLTAQAKAHLDAGQYARALTLFKRLLPVYETAHGPDHLEVAIIVFAIGEIHHRLSQYKKSEEALKRALAIRLKILGDGHVDVGRVYNVLGESSRQMGDYKRSVDYFKTALRIFEATVGKNALEVANVLNNMALLHKIRGRYPKAEALWKRSIAIAEERLGKVHAHIGLMINNLADLYRVLDNFTQAELLYGRALEIYKKTLPAKHPQVAYTLNNLGLLFVQKGSFKRALPLLKEAVAVWTETLGRNNTKVATGLNNLAELYRRQSRYRLAEKHLHLALAIYQKLFKKDHPHIARSLNNLALIYADSGQYKKAVQLLEKVRESFARMMGPAHPFVANALASLADLSRQMGDSTRAQRLNEQALKLFKAAYGQKHTRVARALNGLALVFHERGNLGQAQIYYEQARVMYKELLGPKHPEFINTLTNLALLFQDKGDYRRAQGLFRHGYKITVESFGARHYKVARALDMLSQVELLQGHFGKAEPLLSRALAISEKSVGKRHVQTAKILDSLAFLHSRTRRVRKARKLLKRVLSIYKRRFSGTHPLIARTLIRLGQIAEYTGEIKGARRLYLKAMKIQKQVLGTRHVDLANTYGNLGRLAWLRGRFREATAYLSKEVSIADRLLTASLSVGTERTRRMFLETLTGETNALMTYVVKSGHQAAADLAAAVILQRKGRVLDTLRAGWTALRNNLGDDEIALIRDLRAARDMMARLTLSPPRNVSRDALASRLSELARRAEAMEEKLSQTSAAYCIDASAVTVAEVRKKLPADGALIEWFVYRPFDPKVSIGARRFGAPRFFAFVLTRDGKVRVADLGPVSAVRSAVTAFRKAITGLEPSVRTKGRHLYDLVMAPLEPYLRKVTQLVVSPDGPLNLVPFSALVGKNNHYLAERYPIRRVTSGRDLLREGIPISGQANPLVVANAAFNIRVKKVTLKGKAAKEAAQRTDHMGQLRFSGLPGTAAEGEAIRELLQLKRHQLLTGQEATETRIKSARSPSLLHIATHGFFLPRQQRVRRDVYGGVERRDVYRVENPLLRSGLALAGFNQRSQVRAGDDGALSALEVIGLDLWNTELVVLSACDTGKGKVLPGEGVYGLQRALVLAGSRTQVVSLWKVADLATQRLMVSYYKRLMAGKDKVGAMRQVQMRMLTRNLTPRANGPAAHEDWTHPYYWAAFVVSGQQGPLSKALRSKQ
jgi:CHAT domain-containing protein/Flp pilus assembly protein TadD